MHPTKVGSFFTCWLRRWPEWTHRPTKTPNCPISGPSRVDLFSASRLSATTLTSTSTSSLSKLTSSSSFVDLLSSASSRSECLSWHRCCRWKLEITELSSYENFELGNNSTYCKSSRLIFHLTIFVRPKPVFKFKHNNTWRSAANLLSLSSLP